jgi:hypothetical protein
MSRRRRLLVVAMVAGAGVAIGATGSAATPGVDVNSRASFFNEDLSGYNETPVALSSPGTASFRLQINDRTQEINYRLSYADLPTTVTQAHVHFGSSAQTGGISFFLCTNLGNGPAGTQACPAAPATVTGTIRAADVVGPAAQGIAAGEFQEIVNAIRAGFTYVNVHTTAFPAGEVRSQLEHRH